MRTDGACVRPAKATCSRILVCTHHLSSALTHPPAGLHSPMRLMQIILLGDSAVGKSKLVERFLMDNYHPRQRSTYALTLYRYNTEVDDSFTSPRASSSSSSSSSGSGAPGDSGAASNGAGRKRRVAVDYWDTAGQERFASMHPSYYYKAHACILVFDVTRKVTYTNLQRWYEELRTYCETIPCLVIANKIDVDTAVTAKSFAFPAKHNLPFFYVSAADGTNVVRVFQEAVNLGWAYKHGEKDFVAEVLELLDDRSFLSSNTNIHTGSGASSKTGAVPRPLPPADTSSSSSTKVLQPSTGGAGSMPVAAAAAAAAARQL